MNGKPERPIQKPVADLPPMADDEELGEDIDAPLEDFIDEQRDDGMSWLDDEVGIDDYNAETIAKELGATQEGREPTWLEDSEGDETLEGTEEDFGSDEEYGWTEDNETSESVGFFDDLHLGVEDGPSILDDAGDEGLDDDFVELDTSNWAELTTDEGEGVADLEVIELGGGMTYEQEMRASGALLPAPVDEALLKAAWLGPRGAPAVATRFIDELLVGVGRGLFLSSGEDFTPAVSSALIEELEGTSITQDPTTPGAWFVGTHLGGLVRTDDKGTTFSSCNSWTAAASGCGTEESPSVSATVYSTKKTLWVVTGTSHLLRSEDGGDTWAMIATGVQAGAESSDRDRVVVLIRDVANEETSVHVFSDDDEEQILTIAPELCPTDKLYDAVVALTDDNILVGAEELDLGLLTSPWRENRFEIDEECPCVTALAHFEGPYVYAGLFFPGRDLGTLFRRHGADRWQRICDIERLQKLLRIDEVGVEDLSAQPFHIAVNPALPSQVSVTTGRGVFVIEKKDEK